MVLRTRPLAPTSLMPALWAEIHSRWTSSTRESDNASSRTRKLTSTFGLNVVPCHLFTKTSTVENEANGRVSYTNRMRARRIHAMQGSTGRHGLDVDVDEPGRRRLFGGRGREADPARTARSDANRQSLDTPFAQHGGWHPTHSRRHRLIPGNISDQGNGEEPGLETNFDHGSTRSYRHSHDLSKLHLLQQTCPLHRKFLVLRCFNGPHRVPDALIRKIAGR